MPPIFLPFRPLQRPAHGGNQPLHVVFQNVVGGPHQKAFDRRLFAEGAGNENEGNVGSIFAGRFQGGKAVVTGKGVIRQDQIKEAFLQSPAKILRGLDARDEAIQSGVHQGGTDQFRVLRIVFDVENMDRAVHGESPLVGD